MLCLGENSLNVIKTYPTLDQNQLGSLIHTVFHIKPHTDYVAYYGVEGIFQPSGV